jgi:hypothetical protein
MKCLLRHYLLALRVFFSRERRTVVYLFPVSVITPFSPFCTRLKTPFSVRFQQLSFLCCKSSFMA